MKVTLINFEVRSGKLFLFCIERLKKWQQATSNKEKGKKGPTFAHYEITYLSEENAVL